MAMATSSNPILVTGATGQQGGAVARALIAKGQKVRVMSRHPEKAAALAKAGADVVQGDLTNQAVQTNLFTDTEKKADLYKAIDEVKNRFGKYSLHRASSK